jgi:hypothetical protein
MALQFVLKADDQISPAANKGASSLQRLDAAIKQESRALATLESQMKAVSRAGSVDIETGRKLSSMIDGQRGKVAALTQSMVAAGGAGFSAEASSLNGVLSALGGTSGKLGQTIGKLGPYGMAAAAALTAIGVAATATAGAVGFLAFKLLELGVSASETKGDLTRSLELLYGGEKAAEHTYRVLESLTQDIAISQGRVSELADSLTKAGMVNGDRMVAAIAAIGKAEAARKGAGQVLEGVITRSQQSRMFGISRKELMQVGLSYRELAKEISRGTGMAVGEAELRLRTGGVKLKEGLAALNRVIDSKMGDLANKKLMTVGVQAQRLKDNFSKLFENVNTSGIARLLQALGNTLDQSNFAGKSLRDLLTKMFDEMGAAAERVAPYIQAFFEGGILMALKLYNALYPVRQAIARMFGGDQKAGLESFQNSIISFADKVTRAFELAAKAVAFLIDQLNVFMKSRSDIAEGKKIMSVSAGGQITWVDAPSTAVNAKASGERVADGVAAGIAAGTSKVEKAMTAMADKGTAAFDAKMQIKSPSRLMMIRGKYIDEGVAKGVNDNAEAPAKAVGNMADKAAGAADTSLAGRATGNAAGSAEGGSGVVVHVTFGSNSVVVHGGGVAGVAETQDQLTELMGDVFEKINRIRATGSP